MLGRFRYLPREARMVYVYWASAIVGGTLVACQFLLGLLGLGHHAFDGGHTGNGEVPHDAHGGHSPHQAHAAGAPHAPWLYGMLAFRTIVATVAFFGLAGMTAHANRLAPRPTLA